MSLDEISKNLSINSTVEILEQLNKILDQSEAAVSIWGTRKISYKGDEISLREIAKRVSAVSMICRQNGLDEVRRVEWIGISQKISNFYEKTDAAVANRNFITRLFVLLRECNCFVPYTQRFFYEDGSVESRFCSYSKAALEELKKAIGTASVDGSSGAPLRYYVTKDVIRAKAQKDTLALNKEV